MGNVLISLDFESEALLRRIASEIYGGKKGSISAAIRDALRLLDERKENQSKAQFINLLKKGINSKYKMYSSRSEIYD